eukprot:2166366-Pleurochrysis_carterae.AAC.3
MDGALYGTESIRVGALGDIGTCPSESFVIIAKDHSWHLVTSGHMKTAAETALLPSDDYPMRQGTSGCLACNLND